MTTDRGQLLTSTGIALLFVGATIGGLRVIDVLPAAGVEPISLALLGLGILLLALGQRHRWDTSSAGLASDDELADEVHTWFRDDAPRAMRTLAGYADRVDRAALLSAVHRSGGDLGRLRDALDAHLLHGEP